MKNKITLSWCNKFRKLVKEFEDYDHLVIQEYLKYCKEEEKKINEAFK